MKRLMLATDLGLLAGDVALNFWVLRGDYSLEWWLPNLWLAGFPVVAVAVLLGCRLETVGVRR